LPYCASRPHALLEKLESGTVPTVTMASWENHEPPTSIFSVIAAVARAPKLFLSFTSFRLSPCPL
jgi:hypothetical protein